MNEMENVVSVEESKVWETFSRDQIEQIIQGNIRSVDEKMGQMMELFITSGYYLRRQYNEKMYREAGYDRFEDYVKERYGKSRSWATRMMQINEQYSIDGNDPRIDPKYKLYGVSQLQEMLYLTDEQREQASPDMTVKEIRALKTPAPVEEDQLPGQMNVEDFPEVMPEQEETEDDDELLCDTCMNASSLTGNPDLCQNCASEGSNYKARCITGKSESGYCGAAAHCNEPVSCCAACEDKCNSQCGWLEESKKELKEEPKIDFETLDKMIAVAMSQKEEQCCESEQEPLPADSITTGTIEPPDKVIDAEYTEVAEEITPQSLLEDAKKLLEEYMECDMPKNLIEKQKIYVGALANMVCDLEGMTKPAPPGQPELPVMKNDDQRKEWLRDYKAWGVWYYDENIDVYYYKYDFDNGDRLIVAEYRDRQGYWYGTGKLRTEKHYHLLEKHRRALYRNETYNHKFTHAPDSETYLVDYLKRVTKK